MAKDYAAGGKQRVLQLSADEFLRRWVQHVLPRDFVKISATRDCWPTANARNG